MVDAKLLQVRPDRVPVDWDSEELQAALPQAEDHPSRVELGCCWVITGDEGVQNSMAVAGQPAKRLLGHLQWDVGGPCWVMLAIRPSLPQPEASQQLLPKALGRKQAGSWEPGFLSLGSAMI